VKAHQAHFWLFAWFKGKPRVVDHNPSAAATNDGPEFGEVGWNNRDILRSDILPDVQFCPIRQREHANGFAGLNPRVE
jgi:hypothetical protein